MANGAANPIDQALAPPPSVNPIDAALAPSSVNRIDMALAAPARASAPSNIVDRALMTQPQPSPVPSLGLERATGLSARTPSILERIQAAIGAGAPQGSFAARVTDQAGTTGTPQLITPEAALTPLERERHPVLTGLGEAAGGLTSPENTLLLAGTGGLGSLPGAAGRILPRLVSGYFSASMLKQAYDTVPEVRAAADRGDTAEVKRLLTHMVADVGLGYLAGRHAVKGTAAAAKTEQAKSVPQELAEKVPALAEKPVAADVPKEVSDRIAANAKALQGVIDPAKIQTTADVTQQLSDAQSVLQKTTDPRVTQPLTREATKALAVELGMTEEQLLATRKGTPFSAEQVMASRSLLDASRESLVGAAQAVRNDPGNMDDFLAALARHQEVDAVVRGVAAREAGRALGAFRGEVGTTIADAARALSKLPADAQAEAASRLAKLDPNDSGAIARFTRDITPSSTWDKIHEFWLNGLLSGGISVVKTVSDATMRTLGIAGRPVSAAVDVARFAVTGAPRARFFGETPADVFGMWKGSAKAAAQFADTFLRESTLRESMWEAGPRRAAIKGTLGKVVRTPSRLLEAITDAAQVFNYSADLHAQAFRQAVAEGVSGKEAWGRATEIAANPTLEMRDAAYDYALRQTFQQPLGQIGQAGMNLRNVVPGGRFALPFVKTPANILKAAVDYSPVGAVGTAVKAARGELSGGALSDALAKNAVGTALVGAVVYHALEGNITGGGPISSKDRLRLEAQGWQPYSIKIGDKYVSYKRAEPLGTVLSAAVDVAESLHNGDIGSEGMYNALKQRIGRNIEHAEFIGSLMRLNQIFESPGKYARGLVGSVIPTGVANVAKMLDRTVRKPETVTETLQSRIPGLSQNVPPLTAPAGLPGARVPATARGPEIERPASALGGFNPFPVETAKPGLGALQDYMEQQSRIRAAKAEVKAQRKAAQRGARQ